MKKITFYLIIILSLTISCKKKKDKEQPNGEKEIVRVFDKVLYESEIKNLVPPGTDKEDSINIVQSYINNWVQNQLLLHFAQQYLSDEQAEIDKKTEDFRRTLIINMFKKKLVDANSDSLLNDEDITKYYNEHEDELKLTQPVFKGFWAKIPVDKANKQLINTLKLAEPADIDNIMNEVISAGGNFDNFAGQWAYFDQVLQSLPNTNEGNYCINKFIERKDDKFYYCIKIFDCKEEGDVAPLSLVKDKIKNILTTKKSEQIIDKFVQNRYDSALKNENIVFYDN